MTGSHGVELQVTSQSVILTRRGKRIDDVPLATVTDIAVHRGAIWGRVQIRAANTTLSCRGISYTQAQAFAAVLRVSVSVALLEAYRTNQTIVRQVVARVRLLLDQQKYLANRDLEMLRVSVSTEEQEALQKAQGFVTNDLMPRDGLPTDSFDELALVGDCLSTDSNHVRVRNQRFVSADVTKYGRFFDTVESTPLTQEQRVASVVMEDRNLLVAAAGSGKTSTIVGKIGYALSTGQYTPNDILLLAFNTDAAKELDDRANKQLRALLPDGKRIKATTFHALGLDIISTAQGRQPSVATFAAGDELSDSIFIEQLLAELLTEDPGFAVDWLMFRAVCFKAAEDPVEFETTADWERYVRTHGDYRDGKSGFLTMAGEVVKSQGELAIANWLYLQGVEYEYERPYEYDTATVQHRQYQPDFYLPAIKTYLEHYALDKNGNVPAAFGDKYAEAMAWKQQLHDSKATELITTTFGDFVSGELFAKLKAELERRGQTFAPRPVDDVLNSLNELQKTDYGSFLRTFIKHAKANEVDDATLLSRAKGHRQRFRALIFARAFVKIMAAYQQKLSRAGEIDFEDMIVRATAAVNTGRFRHAYKLIMVDEFQDISQGRAKLVKALLAQAPDCKLFAVGDDWQSIYRFAGSDIEVFTGFSEHFGVTAVNFLTQTFRSNKGITDVASVFIRKNPRQLGKRVVATDKTERGVVVVRRYDNLEAMSEECEACLLEVVASLRGQSRKATVFILGRYRHQRPPRLPEWQARFKSLLNLSYRTIHSLKGLQADHVIIVGMSAGRYAFPSEISDDALLQLVMPAPELLANAEERRLLYVAMTRARNTVYLLGSSHFPSSFLTEIVEEADFKVLRFEQVRDQVSGLGKGPDLQICPSCRRGKLRVRRGRFGEFLGCSNYPGCDYTRNIAAGRRH